jgi:hypothetical protein
MHSDRNGNSTALLRRPTVSSFVEVKKKSVFTSETFASSAFISFISFFIFSGNFRKIRKVFKQLHTNGQLCVCA